MDTCTMAALIRHGCMHSGMNKERCLRRSMQGDAGDAWPRLVLWLQDCFA